MGGVVKKIKKVVGKVIDVVDDIIDTVVDTVVDIVEGVGSVIGGLFGFLSPDIPSVNIRDTGAKIRIPANPDNKLPVIYGRKRTRGIVTFGDISADNQKLAVLVALSEGPCEAIDTIYWDDKALTLNASGVVTNAVDGNNVSHDFLNGNLKIIKMPQGGRSTEMQSFSTRWNSGSANRTMPNICYMYVELTYNREKGVTSLTNDLSAVVRGRRVRTLSNTDVLSTNETYSNNPADCLIDYLTNTRYGCGSVISSDSLLDLSSFGTWRAFCNASVTYTDRSGASATAPAYQSNGILSTTASRQNNIQALVGSAQAHLSYSLGLFKVIVETTGNSRYTFSDDNIYGDFTVVNSGVESLLNRVIMRYDEFDSQDQSNQVYIDASDSVKNANEPELVKEVYTQFIADNLQAERLGRVLLNTSRDNQSIRFKTDLNALRMQPGDIVTVTNTEFAITNKLYRIIQMNETMLDNGVYGFEIIANEYNASAYTVATITQAQLAPNTSFPDPANVGAASSLAVGTIDSDGNIPSFQLSWTVPTVGLITSYDVLYATTSNAADTAFVYHQTLTAQSNTGTFTNGSTASVGVTGLPAGTYYLKVRGRNSYASSALSNQVSITWVPNPTTTAEVQDGSITTPKLADDAVTAVKMDSEFGTFLLADSETNSIRSSSFVQGSAGWNIAGNGDAEFSNLLVRGTSRVLSGTFTGNVRTAPSRVAQQSTDTSFTNANVGIFNNVTEFQLNSVPFFLAFTAAASGTVSSGTIAVSGISFRLFSRISNAAVSSSTRTVSNLSIPAATVFPNSYTSGNTVTSTGTALAQYVDLASPLTWSGLSVSDEYELQMTATVSAVDGGDSVFDSDSLTLRTDIEPDAFGSIEKPSDVTALIGGESQDDFALMVQGGRGMLVPAVELFDGSTTGASVANQPLGGMLYVMVSWTKTGQSYADDYPITTVVPVVIMPFHDDILNRVYLGGADAGGAVSYGTQDIFDVDGLRVCSLRLGYQVGSDGYAAVFINVDTTNFGTGISSQRIRKIWRKF